MARGLRTISGRGGLYPHRNEAGEPFGQRGTTTDCRDRCCDCPTAWVARECDWNVPNAPPECDYKRPPDILVCTTTTCDTGQPIGIGVVFIYEGRCYTVIEGPVPLDGRPVIADKTVVCVSGCEDQRCGVSLWARAIPCGPNYPPLWFCRSQVVRCYTASVGIGGVGIGCYTFDPLAPPSDPPPGLSACSGVPGQFDINLPAGCQIIRNVPSGAEIDPSSCCRCELAFSRCQYVPSEIVQANAVVCTCSDGPYDDYCCPGRSPPPASAIRVYVRIRQRWSPTLEQETVFQGDLTNYSTSQQCAGLQYFGTLSAYVDGVFVYDVPNVQCCFCPLTRVVVADGSEILPVLIDCEGYDPDWICECVGHYHPAYYWGRTTLQSVYDPYNRREFFWQVRAIGVRAHDPSCGGGCNRRFRPVRGGLTNANPAALGTVRDML